MNSPGPRGTVYIDGQPIGEIQTMEVNIEREEVAREGGFGLIGKTFTGTGRIEWKQPTFEELLAAQYNLTPEQAAQMAETIRQAAESWRRTIAEAREIIRGALNQLRESPGFQALLQQMNQAAEELPKHKYERPRLPSQQGYNRTPYDRWRNSLGGGKRRR